MLRCSILLLAVTACLFIQTTHGSQLGTFRSFFLDRRLDNSAQIDLERAYNNIVHPFSQHIAGEVNNRIKNLPSNFSGFFALEESYYTYAGKPTLYKPYLFYFAETQSGSVKLTAYDVPKRIPVDSFKLDNPTWSLDFKELKVSTEFTPAVYTFNAENENFHLYSKTPGSQGTFILNETISMNAFIVMEDVLVDGKSVMPYHTPIIYRPVATTRTEIMDFTHLISVLESGVSVKGVYYYDNCLFNGGPGKGPKAIGGQEIGTWEYFLPGLISKRGYVAFSDAKLIDYPGAYGWIYDYANVRVYDDNKVNIEVKYATPNDFKTIVNETFECTFGKSNGAVFTY